MGRGPEGLYIARGQALFHKRFVGERYFSIPSLFYSNRNGLERITEGN
jgi:hypothetical protein